MVLRTGLAVLMCLTTWAVASVSAWMVPLYLALMALIFVTPRNQHQLSVLSTRRAKLVSNEEPNSGRRRSIVSAGEAENLHLADRPVAESATDEPTVDVTSSAPDPVGATPVKQWRGRTRTRKTGKSAAETASVVPPVTWVRVGPGKFVRADSTTHPIAQVSDEKVRGSATEEHGIAPSAFGPAPTISAPPDPLDHEVPGALLEPTVDPVPVASLGGKASDRDLGFKRPWSQDKRSRARARRVLRGFTSAIPALTKHADGAPSELDLSTEPQFGPRSGPTACRNSRARVPWGGLCAFIAHYVRGHRLTRKYNFAQRISIASP